MTEDEKLSRGARKASTIIGAGIGLISTQWFTIPVSVGIGLITFVVTLILCAIIAVLAKIKRCRRIKWSQRMKKRS